MVHPSLLQRKIIHFDMDAFFAAVEIRDNPNLVGKPVVIGGDPNSRSVVSTASYEARKFGIRSAMACSVAKRLCPDAIFLSPNIAKYKDASEEIRAVFYQYTDLVEPMSLDEAYLDVTQNKAQKFAIQIAREIQHQIFLKTRLTGSAGIAPNKLVAKIASDMRKPNGLTLVLPEHVTEFMRKLPLRKLHGIGPATEKRLLELGLKVCEDVWHFPRETLVDRFGTHADWLIDAAHGLDQRPIETHWERKSIGAEWTLDKDVSTIEEQTSFLKQISAELWERLVRHQKRGRTLTLKIKYADFKSITRSVTADTPLTNEADIFALGTAILTSRVERRDPVRLIGLSVSRFDAEHTAPNH